jgi:uncharacterized phage protein (TIGR01671 family)
MREIKFRAWFTLENKMVEHEHLSLSYSRDEGFDFAFDYLTSFGGEEQGTLNFELMQYTGLKDKNGNEIYEGDILKQTYHIERGNVHDGTYMTFDGHHIGSVVITASKGVCMKSPLCYSEETDETNISNQYKSVAGYRCEVIGNIYENPELLQ